MVYQSRRTDINKRDDFRLNAICGKAEIKTTNFEIWIVDWRPANKSQEVKRKFHITFTEEKSTTIRPPKRSEKTK